MAAKRIAYVPREHPLDMLQGLADGLLDELRSEGVGRVTAVSLTIDVDRGRATADVFGEVCEGQVGLRIFTGEDIQNSANSWIEEEGLGDLKPHLVRADGRVYLLLAGSKE